MQIKNHLSCQAEAFRRNPERKLIPALSQSRGDRQTNVIYTDKEAEQALVSASEADMQENVT